MELACAVALPDRKRFWKDQLFDFGFPPRVIEIAVSYEFRWGDIISDLFIGKFGLQNQYFADALPPYFCEQTLKRLLALALHEGTDSVLIKQLAESLKREGVEVTWTEKPTAQATEAQTPSTTWLSDTQREVLKTVVSQFLETNEPASRILLVKKVVDPDIVDELSPVLLRNPTGGKLFPTAVAFLCCGDGNALKAARSAVQLVIRTLQELFASTGEKVHFSIDEIEEQARLILNTQRTELGSSRDRVAVQLGLYLIQDFRRVHAGIGGVYPSIAHVVVHERIGSINPATAWNEHIEQYSSYLKNRGKKTASGSEMRSLSDVSASATASQSAAPESFVTNSADDRSDGSAQNPVAFISYSWDSEAHKKWVLDLAYRLQGRDGVQVILDKWHLQPGGDRAIFMEKSVKDSDFVILICTQDYARKANNREGGVGYEATIITGELADNIAQGKFIPILRDGDWKLSLPVWIKTKVGVDLRGNPYSDELYQDLLRALHKEPVKPPPVGPKPVFGNSAPVDQEIVPPDWAVRAMVNEDQSSWPDVILECQWPSLIHESKIPASHIVRKRPWMLRHGGPGAVYNVRVHDIDFGEYKASFPFPVRTLNGTATVHPTICQKVYGKPDLAEVITAHDLESLIHNPPSGCDIGQYAAEIDGTEGEEIQLGDFVLEVEIPVTISYDDKNGNRFRIKYLLHYDTYMEKGEMIRTGKIEKIVPK
jgi:hypothetical protein